MIVNQAPLSFLTVLRKAIHQTWHSSTTLAGEVEQYYNEQ